MPFDFIIAAFNDFIWTERKTNFSFLSRHSHCYKHQQELLVVSQADPEDVEAVRKTTVHDAATNYNDWYAFTEPLRSDGFARTVAIERLPGSNRPVHVDDLTVVEFGRKTMNECGAVAWIRDRYCTTADDMYAMRFSQMQYDEQNLWWEGTDQVFRFLELPLEMREAIYLQIIGAVLVPDMVAQSHGRQKLVLGRGHSFVDRNRVGRRVDPDIQRPNMIIMRVSKQVNMEATTVANRDTIKRFTRLQAPVGPRKHPNDIWHNLSVISMPINFLRKLQLEMCATDYLEFSGVRPVQGQPLRRSIAFPFTLSSLNSLNNLDTIDFRFISPKHKLATCPWTGPHSCQKKWIDLFFVAAWNALIMLRGSKGVKYTLSGCVKKSARDYWTELLNDRRVDHTASVRLIEAHIIAAMTDNSSLECQCTNPCVGGSMLFQVEPHEVRLIEGLQAEMDKVYWDVED
ncbi:hypothetical protein G6011_05976 [Alternaria panax]|uniref:Uncharacterized protein n=1 Tax=Alternaria panax TaxID=48097 RepID=A0AAD4FHI8_9PLEO|nr:hypothetical protein G6011_05976 [Alternaria panax]